MAPEREFPFTEEELRRAAGEVTDALLADLPAPEDCAHSFSPDFEEAMAPLLRRQRLRQKRREHLRRAACVLLALLLGGGVWLASDQQARAGFLAWVRESLENAVYLISGHRAEDLKAAWGMPDGMFSGLFGEWWYEGDSQITVFYQNSPEAPEPVIREVSVQPREP